eukprot:13031384-Alexandrium_andersonii.AAC.1
MSHHIKRSHHIERSALTPPPQGLCDKVAGGILDAWPRILCRPACTGAEADGLGRRPSVPSWLMLVAAMRPLAD